MDSVGPYLKRERELRHLSIEEIGQETRIHPRHIASIEDEDWARLPGEVFTRGFIKAYAGALAVETDYVLALYGQKRRAIEVAPPQVQSITPPERGKRVGIAVAMVILVVLFSLALSIALKPRPRDVPLELSLAPSNPIEQVDFAIARA